MIKQQVKSILKKFHLEKIGQEHLIADINRDCTKTQKKILLCYLDYERTVRELNRHFWHAFLNGEFDFHKNKHIRHTDNNAPASDLN